MNKKRNLRAERDLQRKLENRKFILQAAETIFAQKGYSLTSVDDIADEAQFSKATLYRYFKSKSEIFSAVILQSFQDVCDEIQGIRLRQKSTKKKLQNLIYSLLSYYKRKENIARIFLMEGAAMKKVLHMDIGDHVMSPHDHRVIPAEYRKLIANIVNEMEKIIQEGIDAGEFRRLDARDASYVLGSMVRGFHFGSPIREKKYSVEESTKLLYDYFLRGIESKKIIKGAQT